VLCKFARGGLYHTPLSSTLVNRTESELVYTRCITS